MIELACRSASCAPPPIGTGGSLPSTVQRPSFVKDLSFWEPTNEWPEEQALVEMFDQDLGNGVISVIDEVIYPNLESDAPEFTVIVSVIKDNQSVGKAKRRLIFPDAEMTESDWKLTDLGPGVISHDEFVIEDVYQGQGIGGAFVAKTMQAAADANFHTVQTRALSDRTHNGLYTWLRAGFEIESEPSRYEVNSVNQRLSLAGYDPVFTSEWSGQQLLDHLGDDAKDVLGANKSAEDAILTLHYDLTQLRSPKAVAASAAMDQLVEALRDWLEPTSRTATPTIELACRSKACAPPPVGTGGSIAGEFDIEWVEVRSDEDFPTSADLDQDQSVWDNRVPKIPEPLLEWISETGGPYQRLKETEHDLRIWEAKGWVSTLRRGDSSTAERELYRTMTQTQEARRALSLALHDPDGPTPQEAQWYSFVHQAYLERSEQLGITGDLQYVDRDADSSASDPFAPNRHWKSQSEAPNAAGTGVTSWYGVTDPPSDQPPKAGLVVSGRRAWGTQWRGWVSKDQVLGVFGDTPGELLVARDASIIDRLTGKAATTASGVIELACRSRACAPPPVGEGGSLPAGTGVPGASERGLDGRELLHNGIVPEGSAGDDGWKAAVDIMAAGISDENVGSFADVFPDAIANAGLYAVFADSGLSPYWPDHTDIMSLDVEMITRSVALGVDRAPVVLNASGDPMSQSGAVNRDDYTRFISHIPKSKSTHVFYIHNRLRNEDGTWAIPPSFTEFGGPTEGAGDETLGARRAVAAAVRGSWAKGARTTLSNMASKAVTDIGMASDESWQSLKSYVGEDHLSKVTKMKGMQPAVEQAVRAAYNATQSQLRSLGVTEVTIYRGARYAALDSVPAGASAQVQEAPLSSWTTDPYIADDFAGYGSGDGRVLEMTVPASRVFSTAWTGLGSQVEWEVVLLGRSDDSVTVYNRRTRDGSSALQFTDPKPLAASANEDAIFLDADPDHHDWIKVVSRMRRPDADEIMSAITAACRSKSCAPPPVGTGGSVSSGYTAVVDEVRRRYGPGTKPRNRARIGELMHNLLDVRFSKSPPPSDKEIWEILTESKESRSMVSRALKVSDPDPLAIAVMQEAHRRIAAEMPEHAQVMVWRSGRYDSDPFAPRSGPHGTVLHDGFDTNTGTGVTSWWGPPPIDGSKPEDDYRISEQVRSGVMNPGENFQHKFRREAERRSDRQVYEEWVGSDRILGRFGDMRHSGELLVAHTPETINRLMSGTFPIVPAENRVSDWGTVGSANVIELACRSKECAPPPVGSGGSLSVDDFAWDGTTVPMPTRFAETKRATVYDAWLAEVPVLPRPLLEWAATGANLADLPSKRETSGKGAEIVANTAQRILDGEDTPDLHAELWYGLVLTGTSRKALSRAIHEGPSVEEQGLFRIVHEHYLRAAEGLVGDGDAQPVQRYDGNNAYQQGDEPIGPFDPASYWKERGARPAASGTRVTSWFGGDHMPFDHPIKSTDQGTGGARQRWFGDVLKRQVLGRFGDNSNELLVAESPEIIDRLLGRSATTASAAIELACRSKECAPPPVGTGGSISGWAAGITPHGSKVAAAMTSPGEVISTGKVRHVAVPAIVIGTSFEEGALQSPKELSDLLKPYPKGVKVYDSAESEAIEVALSPVLATMPRTRFIYAATEVRSDSHLKGLGSFPEVSEAVTVSQSALADAGYTHVVLYRGVNARNSHMPLSGVSGGRGTSGSTGITSWTTDADAARGYATDAEGAVVAALVPVEQIVGFDVAGLQSSAYDAAFQAGWRSRTSVLDYKRNNPDAAFPSLNVSLTGREVLVADTPEMAQALTRWGDTASPSSAVTASGVIELACRSKACAPPPVGTGGSLPATSGASPIDVQEAAYAGLRKDRMERLADYSVPVDDEFVAGVQERVNESPVAVRMEAAAFAAMAGDDPDPKIRNAYDIEGVADDKGAIYMQQRTSYDEAVGLLPLRTVHGYSSFDANVYHQSGDERLLIRGSSAWWYGQIEVVLNDSVKDRANFTVGDSLNTLAVPLPIRGEIDPEHSATQRFQKFGGGSYVEVQIPGPISMSEIAEINLGPDWLAEDWIDGNDLATLVQAGLSKDVPLTDGDGTRTVAEYLDDFGITV